MYMIPVRYHQHTRTHTNITFVVGRRSVIIIKKNKNKRSVLRSQPQHITPKTTTGNLYSPYGIASVTFCAQFKSVTICALTGVDIHPRKSSSIRIVWINKSWAPVIRFGFKVSALYGRYIVINCVRIRIICFCAFVSVLIWFVRACANTCTCTLYSPLIAIIVTDKRRSTASVLCIKYWINVFLRFVIDPTETICYRNEVWFSLMHLRVQQIQCSIMQRFYN